jgi:Tfp pilus assembly protein PilX
MVPQWQSGRVRSGGEAGAVLITVMLVMLALLGLGIMALWMTSGNLQIGANTNMRNQALYVAEAGIEMVRNDLNGPSRAITTGPNNLLQGGRDLLNDNIPTGLDAAGQPNGVGAVYFLANNTPLTNVAFPPASFNRGSGGNLSTTMGTYTVWIRNDTAEMRTNPLNYTSDGTNGIVVIRSRGVAPDGRTQVTLEVTMGPGNTPANPNAAVNAPAAELCNSGKNGCWENSSVQAGMVVQ